eukprot:UN27492
MKMIKNRKTNKTKINDIHSEQSLVEVRGGDQFPGPNEDEIPKVKTPNLQDLKMGVYDSDKQMNPTFKTSPYSPNISSGSDDQEKKSPQNRRLSELNDISSAEMGDRRTSDVSVIHTDTSDDEETKTEELCTEYTEETSDTHTRATGGT